MRLTDLVLLHEAHILLQVEAPHEHGGGALHQRRGHERAAVDVRQRLEDDDTRTPHETV